MRELLSDLIRRYVLPYVKAYVPVVLGLVWTWLAGFNLDVPVEVQTSVALAVTGFLTWLLPNVPYAGK